MRHWATHPLLLLISLGMVLAVNGCAQQDKSVQPPEAALAPVEASASVDKAVGNTGDIITYAITVNHDAGISLTIPDIGEAIAGFRIIDFGQDPTKTEGGRSVARRWYTLRGDLVGSYILPGVALPYEHEGESATVTTSEIFVEIQSVLPADGSAKDIRGLKPLKRVHLQPQWPRNLAIGGGVGLLLLAGYLLWRRRQHLETVLPPIPPDELAFAALNDLRTTDFSDPEAVRRYYFAISETLRTYLEGRYGFNATDLTTEELLPRLRQHVPLASQATSDLRHFFVHTDHVKFAGHAPSPSEIETTYESALSFVESTRPHSTPESESEEAAA